MAKYKTEDVIAALRASKGMVYVAARQLGCAPNTIYNYAAKYASVQEVLDTERGLMVDTAEIALWKALQNGEGWAISLTLKTVGKDRGYVERQEVSGAGGGAIETRVTVVYADELPGGVDDDPDDHD